MASVNADRFLRWEKKCFVSGLMGGMWVAVPRGVWRCKGIIDRGRPAASVGGARGGKGSAPGPFNKGDTRGEWRGRRRASCRSRGRLDALSVRTSCDDQAGMLGIEGTDFVGHPLSSYQRRRDGGQSASINPNQSTTPGRGFGTLARNGSVLLRRRMGPVSRTRLRSRRRGRAGHWRGVQGGPACATAACHLRACFPSRRSHGRMSPSRVGGTCVLHVRSFSTRRWRRVPSGA